jgi:alpha-galactosidase
VPQEDSCNVDHDSHELAFQQYGTMRDALNSTGRQIYFSLCGWNDWYAPEGASLGNSWRIAGDCNGWDTVYNAIRTNEPLWKFARIGAPFSLPPFILLTTSASAHAFTP